MVVWRVQHLMQHIYSFLRVVLPNDNQNLRGKIVSKNPGVLDPDERLSADIESGMC